MHLKLSPPVVALLRPTPRIIRMRPRVAVCRLAGRIDYTEGSLLQKALVARRRAGAVGDMLLLLEHAPVFSLGRLQESVSNVRVSRKAIADAGASVVQSDRGGNVTFHGPGQLVAYPILDLKQHRRDLKWYVAALEQTMIDTAASFGVEARPGGTAQTGVWVGERKLGAIGVRVARWFSSHGVALNADVDLRFFEMIVPCGLHDAPEVTSLTRELGRRVGVDDVVPSFRDAFARAFDCELHDGDVSNVVREVRAARAMNASVRAAQQEGT